MNKAEELYKKVKEVNFTTDMKLFTKCNDGAIRDVIDTDRSGYYQWLPKLIKHTKPKQIVELGGAMGVSAIAMLQTLPKTSKLYSITLEEHGLEFSFMDKEYPNLVKIVGDDLDLTQWPKDLDLSKTDIWFIDSEHTYEQVRAEIDLYKQFFKEGSILLFDDIHINEGLSRVWEEIKSEIPGDKYESDLHYSGYGIIVVGKEEPVIRDPHLITYGSSYDRGLDILLNMWPEIKKAVPDARLRIFYGWNLFDVAFGDNPERQAWKEKMNKLMEQDGITHLGRISHDAVKKEFETAGIWAYPTYFGEISCITAMKAQAYGAVPCVINYAALKETVKFGVKIDGDIYDKETKDLYCDALIGLLNDPKYQEDVRAEMIPWAQKNFAWQNIAIQWNEEFTRDFTEEEKLGQLEIEVVKLLEDNQVLKSLGFS
jgi:glycosyltransferase involved in cell wall biosynthesis